ncbi:MAG: hypothetical protein WCG95_06995 [bacterium]
MRQILTLCFFLLLSKASAECASIIFPPLQPIGEGSGIQNYSSNIAGATNPFITPAGTNYSDISQIEQTLFGRIYENQTISARLSRIERSLFTTTYPNSTNSQRIDNIILNFNQLNKYPNISKNVLSGIESQILNQDYPQNSPERRIERLEQQLFGATQSGEIDTRYKALMAASKGYKKNNQNYSDLMMPQAGWKNIAGVIGNSLLGGTMTGFTPPINPYYDNYNNNYNNYNNRYNSYPSGYGAYQGYRSNHGYSDNFKNYSNGTGVTILD